MKVFVLFALSVAHVYCREAFTVDPDQGGSLTDLSGTGLTRKYCTVGGSTLGSAGVIEANYCGTPFQCTTRCSQRKDCLSFFYTDNKVCQLLDDRGTPDTPRSGTYFYRLKEGENCPAGSSAYSPPDNSYSNTYCMLWDHKCSGENYYKKPQSIPTMIECLKKCSKIKDCGMVNYDTVNKKCEPLISEPCPDPNLDDAEKFQNFLRLPQGETECPDNREPPSPDPPKPTQPPPEPTEEPEEEEEGEPEPETQLPTANCGGKQYVRKVWNKPGRSVIAACGAGCKMSVCHCRPYNRCNGARFTHDGKCRVDLLTRPKTKPKRKGKKKTKAKKRRFTNRIYAEIKCVPGTSMDVSYVSTQVPGTALKCGNGYRLGDCTFFAHRRDKYTKVWNRGCGIIRSRKGRGCNRIGRCLSTGVCYKKT